MLDYLWQKESTYLNLKGKVKSLRETYFPVRDKLGEYILDKRENKSYLKYYKYYEFNRLGNTTTYDSVSGIDEIKDEDVYFEYEYDKKGNLIKKNKCLDNIGGTIDWEYLYDDDNKLLEIKEFLNSENDCSRETDIYKYDNNGQLIEVDQYNMNGYLSTKWVFEHFNEGKLKKSYHYANGFLHMSFLYNFDENGNPLEVIIYNGDGKLLDRTTYKFDTKCFKLEKIIYCQWDSSIIQEKDTYKYNDDGNLIEHKSYRFDIEEDTKNNWNISYKYEFDKNNNWIKKIQFSNGFPIYIFERKITYFKD